MVARGAQAEDWTVEADETFGGAGDYARHQLTCDDAGNLEYDGEYRYTFDAWNRLVKVLDGANPVAEYRYDGLARRIRKYTDESGDNWTVREYYYNRAWQVLEVRKDTRTRSGGVEPNVATTVYEQFLWSRRYIDAPVLRDRDAAAGGDLGKSGSGLDERLYYLTDANMNVTCLVKTGGDSVERYVYSPYGEVTVLDGDQDSGGDSYEWTVDADMAGADVAQSDVGNPILYCGYYHDSETGLYHVRHRYYDPPLGRWLSRDPIGYAAGLHLYR